MNQQYEQKGNASGKRGYVLRRLRYHWAGLMAARLHRTWSVGLSGLTQEFVHPLWLEAQPIFARLVREGVPYDFLQHPVVRGMFVRTGFAKPQEYELEYLRRSNEKIWALTKMYRESSVGGPVFDCSELGISVNSLGMLYYFARITEHLNNGPLNSIIEFGGGYGSLCRVFLELLPKAPTYMIVDLPEMLAIQYVFLKASSRGYRVVAHTSLPLHVKEGCVNLVPVHLIEGANLKPELFVSTFALSEATSSLQQAIAKCGFFDAGLAYIVGQNIKAEMWRDVSLEPPDTIHAAAYSQYDNVKLNPFHFGDSWELIARTAKGCR
jgi:hypothetical protein